VTRTYQPRSRTVHTVHSSPRQSDSRSASIFGSCGDGRAQVLCLIRCMQGEGPSDLRCSHLHASARPIRTGNHVAIDGRKMKTAETRRDQSWYQSMRECLAHEIDPVLVHPIENNRAASCPKPARRMNIQMGTMKHQGYPRVSRPNHHRSCPA
jgi:hypothetical protein